MDLRWCRGIEDKAGSADGETAQELGCMEALLLKRFREMQLLIYICSGDLGGSTVDVTYTIRVFRSYWNSEELRRQNENDVGHLDGD